MFEHDGCKGCKHELKEFTDFPCSDCRGSFSPLSLFYQKRADRYEPLELEEKDAVNHPKYYATGKYECIDVMCEAIGLEYTKGFCLCNAFKYVYRCTKKHADTTSDVEKAIWYLNKFLELEGEHHDQD